MRGQYVGFPACAPASAVLGSVRFVVPSLGGPLSTSRRIVVALALAAVVPTLVTAAPALADAPQPVPDPATITITGDGYGHGIGMSQYGAYGAANGARLPADPGFYYQGRSSGDAAGKVTVLISADDDRDLVVDTRKGLTVRSLVTGTTLKLSEPRANRWRIRPSGSRSEISYRTRQWHTWRVLKGDAELAAGRPPLTLRTPDGPVDYRGALRSTGTRRATGSRSTWCRWRPTPRRGDERDVPELARSRRCGRRPSPREPMRRTSGRTPAVRRTTSATPRPARRTAARPPSRPAATRR